MKTNSILCPVDFSLCSQMAVQLAGRLANSTGSSSSKGAKVFLLHVTDTSDPASSIVENKVSDSQQRLRDQGQFDPTIKVEYLKLKGKPSAAILEFAKKKKVDLIVMGTRGQSGVKKWFVGSVAEAVMQDAPCPVITINPNTTKT
jgi:nucleotide-binding universal stress UspA family protein